MKRIITTSIPVLLIVLWCYAAFSKLFAVRYFAGQLATHRLFAGYEHLIAWGVPCIELIIASLLLTPSVRRQGLIASAVLLALFSVYILYMFRFYPHAPCTCGGIISSISWRGHIGFNMIFLLLSVTGIFMNKQRTNRPE